MELDRSLIEKLTSLSDKDLQDRLQKIARAMGHQGRITATPEQIRASLSALDAHQIQQAASLLGEEKLSAIQETVRREMENE